VATEFVSIQSNAISGSSRVCDTHTLVTVRVGNPVVIPFAKYLTERERNVEKRKECLVPRQRTE